MKPLRFLLGAALGAATLASQAFAGYLGPNNVVYNYKTITWFHKDIDQWSFNYVSSGSMREEYYVCYNIITTGVVVLGPGGVEAFSASKDWSDRNIGDNIGSSWYWSYYDRLHCTSGGNSYYGRDYERNGSSVNADSDSSTSSASLDVSYPDEVPDTGAVTTSGSGWITVTGAVPDPIVGVTNYLEDYGPSNYMVEFTTAGIQEWAMITWSNSAPSSPSDPEIPGWADEEYEEPVFVYPEIEYPEDP
jgi:hypothetical protein